MEGFGFTDDDVLAIRAAGAVLAYLNETLDQISDKKYRLVDFDAEQLRSLLRDQGDQFVGDPMQFRRWP